MQQRVYYTDICSVYELKQWLIQFWCNPDQDIINMVLNNGASSMSTLYTHSDHIGHVPHDWLAQILCTFFCKRNAIC